MHDFYSINLKTHEINEIKQKNNIPLARRRHSLIIIGSSIILFGGFNGNFLNDLQRLNLFQIKAPNPKEFKFYEPISINQSHKDVNFLCEGMTYNCNKSILTSRNDYFKALFSSSFLEINLLNIEINAFSSKVFSQILDFIHSNEIKYDNFSEVEEIELLKASKFFMVDELNIKMQSRIGKKLLLNLNNIDVFQKILNIYEICVQWNLNLLMKNVIFFISLLDLGKKIKKEEFWCELKNKSQSYETFDLNLIKIKEYQNDLRFWLTF